MRAKGILQEIERANSVFERILIESLIPTDCTVSYIHNHRRTPKRIGPKSEKR